RQTQSLQQRLTPQQVQYLKLLQLPILALEQRIKSEIEENPMLEEASEEEDLDQRNANEMDDRVTVEPMAEAIVEESMMASGETSDQMAVRELQRTKDHEERLEREDRAEAATNDYSFEDFMNDDTEGYKSPTSGHMEEDREEMPHAETESFAESLYNQIAL